MNKLYRLKNNKEMIKNEESKSLMIGNIWKLVEAD
jgi:hypothetical protein